ncbi:hypothetical protein JCM18916_2592 [Cutibacterium acnes JCM 18916]|nr:hypothetical protein JCM18916_2592 [Cutibacterium acnes JCM 18916]
MPVHHHRRPRWRSPFHPLYKPNVECSMLPTGWPTPHDVEDSSADATSNPIVGTVLAACQ